MTKSVAMIWHVYLARCADGTLYCGITTDLERRMAQHNGELPGGARYTRSRGPVELEASAPCTGRSEAAKAEWRVKQLVRGRKVPFIRSLAEGMSEEG